MKPATIRLLTAITVLTAAPLAAAPSHLSVPLSDPAKPAHVQASILAGTIRVVAGKPGEISIDAEATEGDSDHCATCPVIAGSTDRRPERDRDRMRRIPNTSFDLAAEEDHNRVEISSRSWSRSLRVTITVPAASSLTLSTVNDGDIVVEGIGGALDLHNTNGDIRVERARGPVTANTVNGDVTVVFTQEMAKAAMAFSTLNGDVDLTLPAAAQLDVRLRSDNGEIYSDFDVTLAPKAARVEEDRGKGRYRVSMAKELTGKIGGGGPELFLKTFNGDILLRKRGG